MLRRMARPRTVGTHSPSSPFGPVRISREQRAALDAWAKRRKLSSSADAFRDLLDLVVAVGELDNALCAVGYGADAGTERLLWESERTFANGSDAQAALERLRCALGARLTPPEKGEHQTSPE